MESLARKEALDTNEINALIAFAIENGGIEYAEDVMRRMRDEAVSLLSRFDRSDITDSFIALIDFIISRDN